MAQNKLPPDDIDFVRNALRQASITWSGRKDCLKLARKKVLIGRTKKGKAKYKYHWQCAVCLQWSREESSMEVDHIVEIGSFTGDWNEYMNRLFARPVEEHLQAICIPCHMKKTGAYNSAATKWERKK